MAADISVGIAVQGEKEFNKALRECQNTLKQLDSGLRANAAEFEGNENAMRQSKERYEMLTKSIEGNEKIIKSLGEAIEWANREYGEGSTQATKYVTAQNKARVEVAKLKRELAESDGEMEELGRDSVRVGRQLENGIGEAAEDVSRKFDGMVESLDADISAIGKTLDFSVGFDVGKTIVEGASEAGQAIMDLVDRSMDYNRQLSFLEVNAKQAGYDFEKIKDYAIGVAAITGDMDAAVEGMSMLLQAGFEADELATVINRLSGIIIQMPDGMKFENLAESMLETIGTGSAVGQYAEYLDKMGINLETVNKALENAKKTGQEAIETDVIAWLSENGAEQALEQWKKDNADIVEYFTALAELTDAQATLARELTPAATAMVELATELVEKGTGLIGAGKELYQKWTEENKKSQEKEENYAAQIEEETGAYSRLEQIQAELVELEKEGKYNSTETNALLTERAELIRQIAKDMAELDGAAKNEEEFKENLNGFFGIDSAKTTGEDVAETVTVGANERFIEKMPGAGQNAMQSLANAVNDYGYLVINKGKTIGADAGKAMAASMYGSFAAGIESWLPLVNATPIYGPQQQSASVGTSNGAAGNLIATFNVNDRELARATVTAQSAALGDQATRAEMYGP